MDRTRIALTVAAGFDPARADRRVEHVRSAGRTMIVAGVHAQPWLGDPVGDRIVHRLWASLSPRAPSDAELATTEAALVLLADHELAPSTLAARVAASAWSDPYLVALAGLAAVSGSLHGRTSTPVALMLRAAIQSDDPRRAVAEAAGAADASLPGFGHKVYVGTDPRAETLLDLVAELDSPRWPLVDATLTAGTRFTGHDANVDFALAAFVVCAELPDDAGEVVFGLARLAGVVGHTIEETGTGCDSGRARSTRECRRSRPMGTATGRCNARSAGRSCGPGSVRARAPTSRYSARRRRWPRTGCAAHRRRA